MPNKDPKQNVIDLDNKALELSRKITKIHKLCSHSQSNLAHIILKIINN